MDSGRETAFDPSRHGPMTERPRFDAVAARTEREPTFLEQLDQRLRQNNDQAHEAVKRLRDHANRLLGVEPEPAAKNGAGNIPEAAGTVHQLRQLAEYQGYILTEALRILDRLGAL